MYIQRLAVPVVKAAVTYTSGLMLNRSYGVWIFPAKSPIGDRRVLREDRCGHAVQTQFQRAVGIRYVGRSGSSFPDSWGGFIGRGPRARPQKPPDLLVGFFSKGPVKRHRVMFHAGASSALSKYEGHAVLAAKHLRRVGVGGIAVFVGRVRVRVDA